MRDAQAGLLSGDLAFRDLQAVAAPHVSGHRMTVGRPNPLPSWSGNFGICDLGAGQTIHCTAVAPLAEAETVFVSKPGMIVTLLLEGVFEFALNGKACRFEAGEGSLALAWVNLAPVAVTRRMRAGDSLRKCQLHMPLDHLDDAWREGTETFLQRDAEVTAWRPGLAVCEAARALMAPGALSPLRARMAAARFAVAALDSLLIHLESGSGVGAPPQVSEARNLVEQTALDRPTLAEIAARTGYSVSALQRAYRAAYGMTVIEHQRRFLLNHAFALLAGGQVTVAGAAQAVGYTSPSNFTHAFRRLFGVAPSRVRKGAQAATQAA